MSLTTAIVVNAILFTALIVALVWLLAHAGIRRGRHHELRLLRWHSLRRASHSAR